MPHIRTHYDNLKVSKDAPIEVIQAAYRSLARKYHPDLNGGSTPEGEAMMKTINASYAVLSDPVQRAEHDRWIAEQLGRRGSLRPESDAGSERDRHARSTRDRPGNETDTERLTRSLITMVLSLCYFSAAFWMLRNPGARLIGIGMLIAGWLYFSARRRGGRG